MNPIAIARKVQKNGMIGSARKIHRILVPQRSKEMQKYLPQFENARGIEIGGPTPWAFGARGLMPIYPLIGSLDNVNFPSSNMPAGRTFRFDQQKAAGVQYLAEAADLPMIGSHAYDVVLTSHMLEHTSNPIRVLLEWTRLVRSGGLLLIIVPDKERTFDHDRAATTLQHMINDFEANRHEDDLTHLKESLELNDYSMMPGLDREIWETAAAKNLETRYIHHHTFTLSSLRQLLEHARFDILELFTEPPFHLIALVRPGPAAEDSGAQVRRGRGHQ
jgi:SAM-dependent methyltransferase